MGRQLASIAEVAKRAGVSIASASRVLSNSTYPVSAETREKVLRAARELNYVPNSLARGLRMQRSHLIAVLVGDNADPYFAEIVRGVEDVANEAGYLTIVCNSDRNPSKELHHLRVLQDYRVDGVIFAGGGLNESGHPGQLEQAVQSMVNRGAAVITLTQHTLNVPSIQPDNFGGARQMAARLIALGHRRIAFVTGPANVVTANIRLQGYMAALAEAGLPIDPGLLLAGNFDRESGEQAVSALVHMAPEQRPTAIFAANDETAIGVLSGLRRHGWQVPADISVCGFGDIPMASVVVPTLTTVHMGLRDLGRAGTRKLLAYLRHEQVSPLEMQPTTVIERESTAPLPGAQISGDMQGATVSTTHFSFQDR
ncbi:MAG TPA: LacI family DNA-binding transcriptional regulator [Ktedonobacteraceae bacterium]|nr:LacI family DNA-binding transcriptional regulator [Ktedonobacteraceae bacterium]